MNIDTEAIDTLKSNITELEDLLEAMGKRVRASVSMSDGQVLEWCRREKVWCFCIGGVPLINRSIEHILRAAQSVVVLIKQIDNAIEQQNASIEDAASIFEAATSSLRDFGKVP